MSTVGQIEKRTQARIVALFQQRLGYDYLGNQIDSDNRNVEPKLLTTWLQKQGVSDSLISKALHELNRAATDTSKSIFERNREVYELLRYGIKVLPAMGDNKVTVWLIDWKQPQNNHFAVAEEVTVKGADLLASATCHLLVGGIKVEVVRKDIKNLHLGVYPPLGRVRVAVPLVISDEAVRLAVIDKLGWIKRQRAKFAEQPRQSQREMVNGESHYFLGKRYRLRMHIADATPRVAVRGMTSLDLFVRPGATAPQREAVLLAWYRDQLKTLIPPLLEKWQPILGVQASQWGVKKMKTKWGSCNTAAKRIWLNLELAKKPEMCLEYIVVHELVHLLERKHSERFTALMDSYLPNWRVCRETLNRGMLGHEVWEY